MSQLLRPNQAGALITLMFQTLDHTTRGLQVGKTRQTRRAGEVRRGWWVAGQSPAEETRGGTGVGAGGPPARCVLSDISIAAAAFMGAAAARGCTGTAAALTAARLGDGSGGSCSVSPASCEDGVVCAGGSLGAVDDSDASSEAAVTGGGAVSGGGVGARGLGAAGATGGESGESGDHLSPWRCAATALAMLGVMFGLASLRPRAATAIAGDDSSSHESALT
jgi:hypothetical protein